MKLDNITEAKHYNEAYLQPDYWHYKTWLYRPFLKALVAKANLKRGAHILDAGCGQGFFTWLFADLGFKALGVDLSTAGVASAKDKYGFSGAVFEVGDIYSLPYGEVFDCVFTRSLGPYSSDDFEENHTITNSLLKCVKPGGLFIFDYYTRLDPKKSSPGWLYHSLGSVQRHFADYARAKIYFSLRLDTMFLGSAAFSAPIAITNFLISRTTGIGGEAVALVRK